MAQTNDLPVFARRLRQARTRVGLSQKALGIAAGIDEFSASTRVNQYERGIHAPDYSTARRLARVLKVTTAFLYADDDDVAKLLLSLSELPPKRRRELANSLTAST